MSRGTRGIRQLLQLPLRDLSVPSITALYTDAYLLVCLFAFQRFYSGHLPHRLFNLPLFT